MSRRFGISLVVLACATLLIAALQARDTRQPRVDMTLVDDTQAKDVASEARTPVEAPRPQQHRRVLVMLKSRQHVVTVYSGVGRPQGQQFKITSTDGEVLADGLRIGEFQGEFPMLYEFYRTSFAEAWAGTDQAF